MVHRILIHDLTLKAKSRINKVVESTKKTIRNIEVPRMKSILSFISVFALLGFEADPFTPKFEVTYEDAKTHGLYTLAISRMLRNV